MQFKTLAFAAMAAVASAQDLTGILAELPADLQSYVGSLITNTAILGAVADLGSNTAVQAALAGYQTAGANPSAFVANLESAVNQAISAAPSAERALITSVVGVITSDAATDGLLSSVAAIATGSGSAVSAARSAASTALSGAAHPTGGAASGNGTTGANGTNGAASSSRAPSSAGPSQGLAAHPTGLGLGAVVGGVAAIAAFL